MSKHSIFMNGWLFKSKAHLVQVIRRILHGTPLKERVSGTQDHKFLLDLFAHHPNHTTKVMGRKVSHFEPHHNKGGSVCFHAIFLEGGSAHFSYQKCVDAVVNENRSSNSHGEVWVELNLSDYLDI